MTRPRYDNHSTEFGLWLRDNGPDSKAAKLTVTNIDYVFYNYQTGDLRIIEEKRYGKLPTWSQAEVFSILDQLVKRGIEKNPYIKTAKGVVKPIHYHGFSIVRFENTTPDDGWVEVDGQRMTRSEFIKWLNFSYKKAASE